MARRKELTTQEAAIVIGCSNRHVHTLITQGKIKAKKRRDPYFKAGPGFVYTITPKEARRIRDTDLKTNGKGWQRGRPRKT